jgi:SAM-dependent methyltransferase
MDWFARDFDHPLYFEIYRNKEQEAYQEGPALASLLGLPDDSLVLDLPCGWGRLRPWLERRGHWVVGGDLSRLSLQRQQREFPGPSVRLDFRALPFREACADGILCAYTSWGYFATDRENLRQLQEFARVLRPEGVLLLDLAGRRVVEQNVADAPKGWYRAEEGYRERVRWSQDGRRILAERLLEGERFRHDIWIPEDADVRRFLEAAGFVLDQVYGGLNGCPWSDGAERWIYRALRRPGPGSPAGSTRS